MDRTSKFASGEPKLHSYHGVKYTEHFQPEVIDKIRDFQFDSNDIFIASYPKAGTTWTEAIVNLVLSNGDTENYIGGGWPFMEIKYSSMPGSIFEVETSKPAPRRLMTHLQFRFLEKCFKRSRPKVIYVMRNPKDNMVSMYHFTRMNTSLGLYQGSWSEFFDEQLMKDKVCFGDYFDHVKGWWDVRDCHKDHILYLQYEDMCNDLAQVVRQVAEFLGKDLTPELVDRIVDFTSFDKMKANPKTNKTNMPHFRNDIVPFLRKGAVGDWKNYFTEEQNKVIDALTEKTLASRGLSFRFE